ncbi:ATPase domain-containing protein, partial [Bacillus sp. SIMBA_161]
ALDWDLDALTGDGRLTIDTIALTPEDLVVSGSFELGGLLRRLESQIRETGAKRVVLDTVDQLFDSLPAGTTIRRELRHLIN